MHYIYYSDIICVRILYKFYNPHNVTINVFIAAQVYKPVCVMNAFLWMTPEHLM